ncbi:MAG TPA: ABC transporter permease [Firmicutes bacterium]|nr:ABC transporter permease [Candidatus Fermentithermobacillaceae bacterium]
MTFRRLAFSNIKGLRRKYAAFLFSSVLSVIIFYLLASFVLHPDVVNGYVAQAERVRAGLRVAQYMIATFSFFFVLYSSSAFVRSRKKEFGLLSLLGATKRQLSRFVVIEHVIMGLGSVAAGLGLGIPLSKLMLAGMSKMLQVTSPIRFMVVMPAVIQTACLFMALFVVIGFITALQISPRKVIALLREHQRPKTLPSYSPLIALLSVLLIGGGYAVAWHVDGTTIVSAMLPVTFVVSAGTFLFFSQATVWILRKLQGKVSFMYRNLNLLTVGDLVFRMKDNARVLAAVAVLSACVITATGTVYTAQATFLRDEEVSYPHAVTLTISGESDPSEVLASIHKVASDDKVKITEEVFLTGLVAYDGNDGGARLATLIVSEDIYNQWAKEAGRPEVSLEGNQGALLIPWEAKPSEKDRKPLELSFHGKAVTLDAIPHPFPRVNWVYPIGQYVAVDDALFQDLLKDADPSEQAALISLELEAWQKSLKTGRRIRETVPDEHLIGYSSRLESYEAHKQMYALTAMIALFVTGLFFIASGSMLYFRLFGEIDEDREKYRAMRRLGLSKAEIANVVSRQVLVFFFAPITFGASHCGFAMKALSNVLRGQDWPFLGVFRYALWAIAVFSAIQVAYFLFARRAYVREVFEAPGT